MENNLELIEKEISQLLLEIPTGDVRNRLSEINLRVMILRVDEQRAKEGLEPVNKGLNPLALNTLYRSCLNAVGAYEAIKTLGADDALPGFSGCVRNLTQAIAQAENKQL